MSICLVDTEPGTAMDGMCCTARLCDYMCELYGLLYIHCSRLDIYIRVQGPDIV